MMQSVQILLAFYFYPFNTTSPSEALHVSGAFALQGTGTVIQEAGELTGSSSITLAAIPTATYDGAFVDYVVTDGTNKRAGTLSVVFDASNIEWNDVSTLDIGTTAAAEFSPAINGSDAEIRLGLASGTWTVKYHLRKM